MIDTGALIRICPNPYGLKIYNPMDCEMTSKELVSRLDITELIFNPADLHER